MYFNGIIYIFLKQKNYFNKGKMYNLKNTPKASI